MTPALQLAALTAFLVFCRIGACLMLLPGFSSARVAPQMRVLVAFAVALALTPILDVRAAPAADPAPARLLFILVGEIAVGGLLGLMARLQLLGLHFAAGFAAGAIGLQGMPGVPVDDSDATPALTTLISMAATLMLFAAGLHIEILRAIVESYRAIPPASAIDPRFMLRNLMQVTSDSMVLSLRLAGPFAVYSVTVNLAIGFAGKFAPQLSLYFASLGLVTMGGLMLLYLLAPAWLSLFADAYGGWLAALAP